MSRLVFGLLIVFCLWQKFAFAAKPTAPYVLQTSRQPKYDVLRLVNAKTKRVIWTRQWRPNCTDIQVWSEDKRAVAIYLRFQYILVWREGFKPHLFRQPKGDDYVMGFAWSPDNRRILIFSGSSGDDMTPWSRISCLNIRKRHTYPVGYGEGASWLSRRKVVWWEPFNEKDQWQYSKKKCVWYSP